MHLKSLELTGFKSFGKKTELVFHTPIASIVGPNGSGKSNVAEAFRFVLGEQSMKSMRGKKTEDLIFNGGGGDSRGNRASVKLVFDNKKKMFNIDFDEVALERTVFRDGSSEYKINGTEVRLKDIIELLAHAHIGASGHHIISQGEADRILNSNARDRREMIEDALGLKIYQYKRKESERKLDKTEENIRQVESLRKEIAPHIKFLKKQVEKLEKAKEMKDELIKLYAEYLKREDFYIKNSKANILRGMKGPKEKMEELERLLSKARETLEASKEKDKKSDEIIKLERDLREKRGLRDSVTLSIGKLEGELSSLERMLARQKENAFKEEHKQVPLREVEEIAESISRIENEISNEENISSVKSAIQKIKESILSFIRKHKDSTPSASFTESEKEIERIREEKNKLANDLSEIKKAEAELEDSYASLREEIEKEKDTGRDAEKDVFKIVAEQNEVRAKLAELSGREERLRLEEVEFRREIEEGAVLVGREVLNYENKGDLDLDEREDRSKQEERRRNIEKIKIRLEDSGLTSGDDVMKEYGEATERDQFLERELTDLEKTASSLKGLIRELGEKIDTEFKDGIIKINHEFQTFFSLMFGGGSSSLQVVKEEKRKRRSEMDILTGDDSEIEASMEEAGEDEETETGVEIQVNLPRKKIKGLMMLSGGERALTSIALIFAMSQVNPPPFLILDETDAALDEANSKKYGDMIENLSKKSQLILITHNRETMSRAGVIYGVTMDKSGISKLLSIAFDEAVAVAK